MDKREIFVAVWLVLGIFGLGVEMQRLGKTETKTYNGAGIIANLITLGWATWVLFY